jgi:hypothetical protein
MLKRFFLLIILFSPLTSYAEDLAAKVVKVLGTVTAIDANKQSRTLSRGSDISPKDTVVTASDGSVSLRFTDGTVIDVAADSKYIIHEYTFNEAQPKNDKFSSEVVEGGFRAITGTIGVRNPTAFSAKANLTTLTVRGTLFYLLCSNGCADVTQFTLEGVTAVRYNGKEYLMGPTEEQSTFLLNQGRVNLSREIPSQLQNRFSGDIEKFKAMKKGHGGGGGSDPCGTLKAVGAAVN